MFHVSKLFLIFSSIILLILFDFVSTQQSSHRFVDAKDDDKFFADSDAVDVSQIKKKMSNRFFQQSELNQVPSKTVKDEKLKDNEISVRSYPDRKSLSSSTKTTGSQFSCTKRALLMYKLIVNSIHFRILELWNSNTNKTGLNLILNLSPTDIELLTEHLEELDKIIVHRGGGNRGGGEDHEEEDEELLRFCRNLNNIETNIKSLIENTNVLDDESTNGMFSFNVLRSYFRMSKDRNPLTKSMTMLFFTIQFIIFYVQRYYVRSIRTLVLGTIVNVVIFVSLYQHYENMYRKFESEQSRIEYNRQRYCDSWYWSYFSAESYDCSQYYQNSRPTFNPTALELLIQYVVGIWLSTFELITTSLNKLLETLFDVNQYSLFQYYLLKPFMAVVVIAISYYSFGFITIFQGIIYVINLLSGNNEVQPTQQINSIAGVGGRENLGVSNSNSTTTTPNSVLNVNNLTVNYYSSHTEPPTIPIGNGTNEFRTNPSNFFDPDEEYLSALEDVD